jgi:hypothetical protein
MKNIEKYNIKINKSSTYIFNELYDNDNIRNKVFKINSFNKGIWYEDNDGLLKKKEYININLGSQDDIPNIIYKLTDNGNINIKIKNMVINKTEFHYKIKTRYSIKNKNKLFNSIINKIVKIKNDLYITRIDKEISAIDIKLRIKSFLPFNTIIENYVAIQCNKYIDEIIAFFSE